MNMYELEFFFLQKKESTTYIHRRTIPSFMENADQGVQFCIVVQKEVAIRIFFPYLIALVGGQYKVVLSQNLCPELY